MNFVERSTGDPMIGCQQVDRCVGDDSMSIWRSSGPIGDREVMTSRAWSSQNGGCQHGLT